MLNVKTIDVLFAITKKVTYGMGLAGLFCSAAAMADEPLSFSHSEIDQPQMTQVSGFDNALLEQRDAIKQARNPRSYVLQFAEPQTVSVSPDTWQQVQVLNAGSAVEMSVWRTQVESPGALSLNFGFSQFRLPEGASLHIYTPDGSQRIRPFTAADNDDHGQLWTPMIAGDTAIIEVNIPAGKEKQLKLELASVNHGYVGASAQEVYLAKSGDCNVDVVCPVGDAWRAQIRSTAAISVNGTLFCSGGAINNTANDGTAYFLTAYHCNVDSSNAASVVAYWNYENSTCREPGSVASGDLGDGELSQFSTGAIFRSAYEPSDMTLIELDDPLDPSHDVYLAGWNARNNTASSVVAIHHPNLNEKRISFENDPTTITSYLSEDITGDGTHLRVTDWDLGTTEPGSSGSLLFDQNKRVIGQLHGGDAACGNDLSDWYGRLYVSWDGGGTAATRLSSWLDASGTGQLVLNGVNATDVGSNYMPVVNANGPYLGLVDQPVTFSSAGTIDRDGTIASYEWDFGDGSIGRAANPQHSYSQDGTFEVSLKATDNEGGSRKVYTQVKIVGSGQELHNGTAKTGVAATAGDASYFYMEVPEGATDLVFSTKGANGDADLYVSRGSLPTTSSYNCRSWATNSSETCTISSPQAGTWFIMVYAYVGYTNLSLTGSYQEPAGTGALGDLVWNDLDGDGVKDAGEPGLAGVTVKLQSCQGVVQATTTTDSSGLFKFSDLGASDYRLKFILPAGYQFSPERSGSDYELDSNANETTGVTPCYDMSQGFQRLAVDAGMVSSGDGVMGDFVWQDDNGNGVQDADEAGLSGVTVRLQTCAGVAVDTMVTDNQGAFAFENIAPGNYRMKVLLLDGYEFSPERASGQYQYDSNVNETTGLTGCYSMSAGQTRRAIDAGMVPTAAVSDNLSVVKAIYFRDTNKLWVRAASDARPVGSSVITASVTANGKATMLGQVGWKSVNGFYQANFDVTSVPNSITLTSESGGNTSASVETH